MRNLMSMLPDYYVSSKEMQAIQNSFEQELQTAWTGRDSFLEQLNPNTATWGLEMWEAAFGLTSDANAELSQRRARVIARIRGMAPTTPAVIKSVVEAFCPGAEVAIIEHFSDYVVEIHLKVFDASVEDHVGLEDSLQLIMPAHLDRIYSTTIDASGGMMCAAGSEANAKIEIYPEGDLHDG